MSQMTLDTLSHLRDPLLFKWHVISLFAFVVYIYAVEIERKNWDLVLAGLVVWGMDTFLEIINALFLYFSKFSAVWMEIGPTSYQIFIGLNIETYFMFAVMGIVFGKMLPKDKNRKILGLPNRWFFIVINSLFCVFIEVLLNHMGVLVWNYHWWNFPNVWLIILFGYAPYFLGAYYIIDLPSMKKKVCLVSALWFIDLIALAVLLPLGVI